MPSNTLVLPLILWDNISPHCNISSIITSEHNNCVITGTTNGHIILWNFKDSKLSPMCLFMGHTSSVLCLANAGHSKDEEYFVSSSDNGSASNSKRLYCIGNYTDVLVIDPMTLEIMHTLVSRDQAQWINVLFINTKQELLEDIIVGISITGIIKLWTLNTHELQKGSEIVEHEYKNCECENAKTLVSCPDKQRIFLVVCPNFFQIFDAVYFNILCVMHSAKNETFNCGYFLDNDQILIGTNDGYFYVYQLPENSDPHSTKFGTKSTKFEKFEPILLKKYAEEFENELFTPPIFYFFNQNYHKNSFCLLRGDCYGNLAYWNFDNFENCHEKKWTQSLRIFWEENIEKDDEDMGHISTFLFLPNLDKLIYGTIDGDIVILSAFDYIIRRLFEINSTNSKYLSKPIKLKKHTSRVTTLLYPNADNPRYDPSYLCSGGIDFSVILWNINTGDMIFKFIVQAGEILQLSLPPANVNPRISQCVCSIASDNSVALLSLKECKPVMVASRHLFPVLFIKWRPLDDYLIVKCTDGGVYVWQMETGNLDRVAHGLLAEDIISAADELAENNGSNQLKMHNQIVCGNKITNQTLSLINNLQKRRCSNAIKSISIKTASVISGGGVGGAKETLNGQEQQHNMLNYPLVMQPFHFDPHDPVNNLLLFDIDNLLVNLMLEEQSIESLVQHIKTQIYKEIYSTVPTPPSQIAPLYRTTTDHSVNTIRKIASSKTLDNNDMKLLNAFKNKVTYATSIVKITKILLSCLHAWGLDDEMDMLFIDKLGLYRPRMNISYGQISRGYHVTLMFPQKTHKLKRPHWNISKCLTTEHLLTILSIANAYMNLQNFVNLQFKSDLDVMDLILSNGPLSPNSQEQSIIKQAYSRLSTMYCMLGDYFLNEISYKSLNLEILAQKWMDLSYDIREAAQALLKNELKRIGSSGRLSLIKLWETHLSTLLKEYEDSNNNSISLTSSNNQDVSSDSSSSSSSLTSSQQHSHQPTPMLQRSLSKEGNQLNRIKTKQYIAIIILGIMGAEFGQDVNTTNSKTTSATTVTTQSVNNILQGFSIEDHSILKRVSIALTKLLTNRSLQNDVHRRASIDLIGRGFNIWEPFIQPTFVILSLLELCAEADAYIPKSTLNLPLSPIADTCRTARNAITLIANTKPKTFILTIAKEVKRLNTQQPPMPSQSPANSAYSNSNNPIVKAKLEILKIIEKLFESQSQDVYELLSDVLEIVLHCLDMNQTRSQSNIEEQYPIIFKFPMIKYCKEAKRIFAGCQNGRLIMYEFRNTKWTYQAYSAHNNQSINAIGISNDSKYVASYSASDNSVYIWQLSSGNIFNIGSNSLKQIKTSSVASVSYQQSSPIKIANIVWQSRNFYLNYFDGRKFTFQI